jgi:hypothetical protein
LLALGLLFLARQLTNPTAALLGLGGGALLAIGFFLGLVALLGIRKHGTRGILLPGIAGMVVNGLLFGIFCQGFYTGWSQRQAAVRTSATNAVSGAESTSSAGQQPGTKPGKLPQNGQPILTILEPGTEPRKLLRFQPKPGEKQTVVFTSKQFMNSGPFTNLPAIVETVEVTIKNVSANGDTAYGSVIKDVRVLTEPGAPPPTPEMDIKAAFSSIKGLITSGVVSSQGGNRRTQIKNPTSGKQLPAIVRLVHDQRDAVLGDIAFPDEPVGAGAKWEIKEESRGGAKTSVYEVRSIENDRVALRIRNDQRESTGNAEGPTMRTSADITLDLGHIVPERGSITYQMEGPGPDDPSGKPSTMRMRMDLRVEPK